MTQQKLDLKEVYYETEKTVITSLEEYDKWMDNQRFEKSVRNIPRGWNDTNSI